MSDNTLRCDRCDEPLIDCECGPEDGEPVDGDLITQDLVHFYEKTSILIGPAVVVGPGQDYRTVLLAWMFEHRNYPNVWHLDADGTATKLPLGGDDDDD